MICERMATKVKGKVCKMIDTPAMMCGLEGVTKGRQS